jgi:hypothetical protein
MRRLFRVTRDRRGNPPSLSAIFSDILAPVVRTAPNRERELTMMRWGFPPPPNLGTVPVTRRDKSTSPFKTNKNAVSKMAVGALMVPTHV